MKLITIDFETYYSNEYGLNKMTTEEYIRDPRFETIMCGYKTNNGQPKFVVGKDAVQTLLDSLDIENNTVLAHHAHFDGLILSHHFNHRPKIWFDTLSMARAVHGTEVGGSLAALLAYYQVGITKGTYVADAKGKRLADFGNPATSDSLMHYGRYCCDDVEGTYRLFMKMLVDFPKGELKQIDRIVRMFTEPTLLLDEAMLREYAMTLQSEKLTLLWEAGVTLDEVMSNDKFAEALKRLGIVPPEKISLTTGKPTYAFAKTDKALQDLAEHENEAVQTLVAARLGNKSTINETRAIRMADMSIRGPACLYYKYAGAMQTMRVSGGDSMNWQNLTRGGTLREAVYAPEGYLLVVVDSSNIEARVLDWLAMQEDMLEVYRKNDRGEGPDVYCVMAGKLYQREITPADKLERQTGKTIKIACGYQMGPERFKETARTTGKIVLTLQEAVNAVQAYRTAHPMVVQLWNRAQSSLPSLAAGPDAQLSVDSRGVLRLEKGAIVLPNGLRLKYPGLSFDTATQWSFSARKGVRSHLYGGKIIENATQALARIVVMDQTGVIAKRYKEAMTTHDELVIMVKENEAEEALKFAVECMSQSPKWAPDLPVSAKGAIAVRYGDAK